MELITPKVEIWEQGDGLANLWKHIAICTRVCYQSTPKNNGESDEEFVKRVETKINEDYEEFLNQPNEKIIIKSGEYLEDALIRVGILKK